MDDTDIRREQIRVFANALVHHYNFPDESEAQREVWEVRKRLEAGEPVDAELLGSIAKHAEEAQMRATLQELYGTERADELMTVFHGLRD
jgi:hypothetical protein